MKNKDTIICAIDVDDNIEEAWKSDRGDGETSQCVDGISIESHLV